MDFGVGACALSVQWIVIEIPLQALVHAVTYGNATVHAVTYGNATVHAVTYGNAMENSGARSNIRKCNGILLYTQ
jgi:hypothetical protein